ncbi:uncharacterized protein LOC106460741 [Limulus polyphemus]|uniref:Uncharacterized protein LOC106460741 n=1 Tax=Limulus polyphemus TaxID=6850 RepID=A0ABM1SHX1_LIMPO|nr:uncharacterized protein LOC106460741 [Limulus polyphemus]XP_022243228.1 uncharacterized protein LOC106460741 [Limulus polyphemus]XP_022243229.1 uncharacterized protein LOC106460741 [Limulus polyphemus]
MQDKMNKPSSRPEWRLFFMLLYSGMIISSRAVTPSTRLKEVGRPTVENSDKRAPQLTESASCGSLCAGLEALGPPPDVIIVMPPPPLPSFVQSSLQLNHTEKLECNFCHVFDGSSDGSIPFPFPTMKSTETWISITVVIVAGSAVLIAAILGFLLKFKKWKIFPVAGDSCPILPESFLNSKGGSQTSFPKNLQSPNCPKKNDKTGKNQGTSSCHWFHVPGHCIPQQVCDYQTSRKFSTYIAGSVSSSTESPECADVNQQSDGTTSKVHMYACIPDLEVTRRLAAGAEQLGNKAYDNAGFLTSSSEENNPFKQKGWNQKVSGCILPRPSHLTSAQAAKVLSDLPSNVARNSSPSTQFPSLSNVRALRLRSEMPRSAQVLHRPLPPLPVEEI